MAKATPKKKTKQAPEPAPMSDITAMVLMILGILSCMAFFTYDPYDVSVYQVPPNNPPHNWIGPTGAWAGFLGYALLGVVGNLIPFTLLGLGLLGFIRYKGPWLKKAGLVFLLLMVLAALAQLGPHLFEKATQRLNLMSAGGLIGQVLGTWILERLIGAAGAVVLLFGLAGLIVILLFHLQPAHFSDGIAQAVAFIRVWIMERTGQFSRLRAAVATGAKPDPSKPAPKKTSSRKRNATTEPDAEALERIRRLQEEMERMREAQALVDEAEETPVEPETEPDLPETPMPENTTSQDLEMLSSDDETPYTLPSLDLLNELPPGHSRYGESDVETSSLLLEETLRTFGVDCQVTNVEQGPVVTRFDVLPAPGVKVEKIANLSNNIALALKAESIRVQAPVPGKGVVGVEIPNQKSSIVYFRQIVESKAFKPRKQALPIVLGMDVSGQEIVGDLAGMPHLLIAGATGSGKSVSMNSLLAGLFMCRTPSELRLMLIDPKVVEFSAYNNLPHLVTPVINDTKKASLGLMWAVNEMEKRYQLFGRIGVKDIISFNNRKQKPDLEPTLFDKLDEQEEPLPKKLPYIVIIIDELADLMMAAKSDVEHSIARIAQKGRASGIHIVIATQRPSVNVITGVIKANFPARIAFQVASQVDSRTILDGQGAEKLLGKGDMLFMPKGAQKIIRVQGSYASDEEIGRLVSFIKEQGEPEYMADAKKNIEEAIAQDAEGGGVDDEDAALLQQAIQVIRETRRASTSMLQRRMRIGYNRAARLMDDLEQKGIIGPPNGSEPREILIDLDG